uniref:ADP-ribosylhydrolase ARH3 n=1 Tax=Piromyces sp. TaxID=45796 RepID=A0A2S1TZH9_PIRSP|nr:ADP-ribosylarginine hydrolase [Piromyces sp.]
MNKIKDSLYGFVVGDALGVPVEFRSRVYLSDNPVTEMIGYGTHNVPPGVWSDDTSMTLATMDSIIKTKTINCNDMADRFCSWVNNSEYSAVDIVFDIGMTTSNALKLYQSCRDANTCGSNSIVSNGNGSLMRMLPIAFYCYYKQPSESEIFEIVKKTSGITHAHEISVMGCYIYVRYLMNLLQGKDKKESYNMIQKLSYSMFTDETQKVYQRIIKEDISTFDEVDIKSNGYVVSTLEASLWTVLNNTNLKDTILTAVNLGGDTDTVGAVTGSIAGMIYNYDDIPESWIEKLKKKDYINNIITEFYNVITQLSNKNSLSNASSRSRLLNNGSNKKVNKNKCSCLCM